MDILQQIESRLKLLEQNKVEIENKLSDVKNDLVSDTGSFKVKVPDYNTYLTNFPTNQTNNEIDYSKHKKRNEYLINNKTSNLNKVKFNEQSITDNLHKVYSFTDLNYQQGGVSNLINNEFLVEYIQQRDNDYIDNMLN